MKRLLRSGPVQRLLSFLFQRYLWLVLHTSRWTHDGAEHLAAQMDGASAVLGFWHEFLPCMAALRIIALRSPEYRPIPIYALVSRHRDGRYLGAVLAWFKIRPVHGSSSRGGSAGSRRLVSLLKGGAIVAITPDGPRGPRRRAAPGLAQLAALAMVPVIPCAAGTSCGIPLRSWDRMRIPLPFGRGAVVCGPAVWVTHDSWREAVPALTIAMDAVADRLDKLLGLS